MALPDLSSYVMNPGAYGRVPVIPPTTTNRQNVTTGWQTSLPNYDALAAQASGTIGNQLAGTLNPEDIANAKEWMAGRGQMGGFGPNAPNNLAAYQHFLGLSSQQLKQQGLTNLNAAAAALPRTTTADTTQTIDNNLLQAYANAAPDPMLARLAELGASQAGQQAGGGAAGAGGVSAYPRVAGGGGGAPLSPSSIPAIGPQGGTGPFNTVDPVAAYQRWLAQMSGTGLGAPSAGMSIPGASPVSPFSGSTGFPQGAYQGSPGAVSTGFNQGVVDSRGDEWWPLGDGSYLNMNTGDVQMGTPGSSSIFGGIQTNPGVAGSGTYDMFDPSGLLPAYGSMPDYSQVGTDPMAGLLGGGGALEAGYQPVSQGSMYMGGAQDYSGDYGYGYQPVGQGSMYMGENTDYYGDSYFGDPGSEYDLTFGGG